MVERRPSLAYRALDAQVLAGLADEPALVSEDGTFTYAQLLHESASIAGALQQLGVKEGDDVVLEVPRSHEQVVVVLALARLGAVPAGTGERRLVGTPPVYFHGDDEPVSWRILLQAGRTDPASARPSDTDEYEQLLLDTYEDVFTTLLAGGTID